jgi:hypothetical protein
MSVLEAVLTLALLAAVITVVSGPLRAAHTTKGARSSRHGEGHAQGAHVEQVGGLARSERPERGELEAAREAKYREIRDTELDYRTGKLSREDYEAVNGALRAEAVAILNRLDALGEEPAPGAPK